MGVSGYWVFTYWRYYYIYHSVNDNIAGKLVQRYIKYHKEITVKINDVAKGHLQLRDGCEMN